MLTNQENSPFVKLSEQTISDYKKRGICLDYSIESLKKLDLIINDYLNAEKPTNWNDALRGYACYAGETIIKNFGGFWTVKGQDPNQIFINGIGGYEMEISPFQQISKRFSDPDKTFFLLVTSINHTLKTDSNNLLPIAEIPLSKQFLEHSVMVDYPILDKKGTLDLLVIRDIQQLVHIRILFNSSRNYPNIDALIRHYSSKIEQVKGHTKADYYELFCMIKRDHPIWKEVNSFKNTKKIKNELLKTYHLDVLALIEDTGKLYLRFDK